MTNKLNRRQALRLMTLGGLGGLVAACTPAQAELPLPAQPPPLPTPTPALALAQPTATTRSSTATPAPTVSNQTSSTPTSAPDTPTAAPTETPPPDTLIQNITRAATEFLESLDDAQRTKATYTFGDAERVRWHWTTPSGFPRNGLPLREMSAAQRDLALALLRVSVSEAGYQKALNIISLQNDLGNDPELYFVTVFGAPGGADPWSWRFEGHHLSRHFTVVTDQVVMTPFFLGAWPTLNDAGLRAMPREEDAARELVLSLDEARRASAIFQADSLTSHLTQNQPYTGPLEPVGILVGDLGPDQQKLVLEIVQTYLNTLPGDIATPIFERIHRAGFEQLRFGWAGPLEPRRPQYYRLQGPTFLLEFDNSRNGGTHIHSVWRDFEQDFGQHLV
jgi:hypothetical protein